MNPSIGPASPASPAPLPPCSPVPRISAPTWPRGCCCRTRGAQATRSATSSRPASLQRSRSRWWTRSSPAGREGQGCASQPGRQQGRDETEEQPDSHPPGPHLPAEPSSCAVAAVSDAAAGPSKQQSSLAGVLLSDVTPLAVRALCTSFASVEGSSDSSFCQRLYFNGRMYLSVRMN